VLEQNNAAQAFYDAVGGKLRRSRRAVIDQYRLVPGRLPGDGVDRSRLGSRATTAASKINT
jgi:hypothetical protein